MSNIDNRNRAADGQNGFFESRPADSTYRTSPNTADSNAYGFYNNMNCRGGALPGKRVFETDKKDTVFFFVFAVLSFLTLRLGVLTGFGLGFSVTSTLMLCCVAAFVYNKDAKHKSWYFTLLFILFLFCFSFFFNNDPLIKFFDLCALFVIGFICFNGISANALLWDGTHKEVLEGLYSGVIKPFENIAVPFSSFKSAAKSGKNKILLQALIGVGVALPLLLVIVFLLVSSDVAFENLLTKLFSDVTKLVLALFLTLIVLPVLYSYGFALRKKAGKPANLGASKIEGRLSAVIANTVLSVISAAYILYLVSQLAYITKAFAFLLPDDYSSSRFAREGFFQMLVVAAINLVLILSASVLVRRGENGNMPLSTRILNAFLCLFTLFYIATAFFKMAQYISHFGYTYLRVATSVFMVMLAVIMIFAFVGLFFKKLPVVRCAIVTVSAALLLLSFVDVNAFVSKVNYRLYSESKITLDVNDVYKYEAEEEIKLFSSDDKKIKYAAYTNLCELYGMNLSDEDLAEAELNKNNTLGSNIPEMRSEAALAKYRSQFEKESERFEKEVFEAERRGEAKLYYDCDE